MLIFFFSSTMDEMKLIEVKEVGFLLLCLFKRPDGAEKYFIIINY